MEYKDLSFAQHLAGLASLSSQRKPVADPANLTAIQLINKMVQMEDHVRTIMYEMTNQLMLSPRTTSLVLIFPLAVNLIYIFGDGPLDRVYIDTLSSVSYSFGSFDIDALQTPPCG